MSQTNDSVHNFNNLSDRCGFGFGYQLMVGFDTDLVDKPSGEKIGKVMDGAMFTVTPKKTAGSCWISRGG